MKNDLMILQKEEEDYDFKIVKGEVFVSSLYVAKIVGKKHKHVARDIREITSKDDTEFSQSNFGLSNYTNNRGKEYPLYWLTEDGSSVLLGGYSIEHRVKIQKELRGFKNSQIKKIPQTYGEALLEAGRLAIENERLRLEGSYKTLCMI